MMKLATICALLLVSLAGSLSQAHGGQPDAAQAERSPGGPRADAVVFDMGTNELSLKHMAAARQNCITACLLRRTGDNRLGWAKKDMDLKPLGNGQWSCGCETKPVEGYKMIE